MARGAPGRGSSNTPPSRPTRKRSRHLQTVAPVTCNFFATTPLLHPSSHPSTILARIASAWADFGRRASIASFSFSSGVTFSGLVGRPMATFEYAAISVLFQFFPTQDTRGSISPYARLRLLYVSRQHSCAGRANGKLVVADLHDRPDFATGTYD